MNKQTKIILIITCIVLISFLITFLIIKFDIHILKISDVTDGIVTARSDDNKAYIFFPTKSSIILKDFKEIEISELKKDDIIFLFNEVPEVITLESFSTKEGEYLKKIPDVKLIVFLK